ncbi:MAG TPA: 2-C-methyl-D-erythritol 4-phosphate cytidylyltransferase [Gammaproteobacteria bacterium]|nr:2-C-methyl-D-erythritol 4-phosphate cytidylyltransferase [Gammaproteobacteria bacterium]
MQANISVVIAGAGIGARFGVNLPKQYHKIGNKTVLEHSIKSMQQVFTQSTMVVALNPHDQWFHTLEIANDSRVIPIRGGETRGESIWHALEFLKKSPTPWVLIHDAVRPCVPQSDIERLVKLAQSHPPGGILAAPSIDTLKRVQHKKITQTVNRNLIWRALTPQLFEFDKLYFAYEKARKEEIEITDDAYVMELAGLSPYVVEGSSINIKITYPHDLKVASSYLQAKEEICL